MAGTAARSGLTIGVVAGEASGDNLGVALIEALRERVPDLQVFGVAGPKMRAAGCEVLADAEELSVMGLTEILRHLPRLFALRRRLRTTLLARRPDVFVGIDSPEFNLGLARQLKQAGIATVQYVSPQVWAWRQGRVRTIGRAIDLVLCLLPFEPRFYAEHGVPALFVGHPLADRFPLQPDCAAARRELGLGPADSVLAVLPGSRLGEVTRLGKDFAGAAAWLAARVPGLKVIAPMASARVRARFEQAVAEAAPGVDWRLLEGRSQAALAAADVVLVASGTATLETLLSKRPMVVGYRVGAITALLLRRLGLLKVEYVAQPNLLVGERVVPEFLQDAVQSDALGAALLGQLESARHDDALARRFLAVHEALRQGGAGRAADAILELVRARAAG
ncbi:MAG: lipid-A-disaccharide synthase [Steroidobacteraceae bacterium]|nr:lipid-A-disaccharide synthase [Nevskiaceae bacterium]MCP5360612.1 lipid-A-disaccharide synthase [Nevskiaceae bacterium]MCP5467226.1 lipid-A-disaccharide synthase [Nevskiaceae bacterium]